MRVIAGSARRLQLETPKGMHTRPTLDREKETLFNMLQSDIEGSIFLDLFSGSGQIGIESLSRGAKQAYFVEQDTEALRCIRKNLCFTHLSDRAVILGQDVLSALRVLDGRGLCFDYIFMDPPYDKKMEPDVLMTLADTLLVQENTRIIVESRLSETFEYLDRLPFMWEKEKRYKTNMHTFLVRR